MLLCENLARLFAAAPMFRCALLLLASLAFSSVARSQQATSQPPLIQQIGIQGHWKLGHCCMVRVVVPSTFLDQAAAVEITTLDGDGVEVVYRRKLAKLTDNMIEVPIRIGRQKSVITASLLDVQAKIIATENQDLADTSGFSATQPMVLCIGASMGLEELVRVNSTDETQRNLSIITIQDAKELPSSWLAYQPFNLLVISTANAELLRAIEPDQWQSVEQWVRRGGNCIVSMGGKAEEVRSVERLKIFLPGDVLDDANIASPAALESMIITEQQLQKFPAILFAATHGRIQLGLKDSLSRLVPWWVSMSLGNGSVQVVASDLSHASFADWKQRKTLWERLVSPYINKSMLDGSQSEQDAAISYLGYSDLIGQLRASLDQFRGVTTVGFSTVAGILLSILLLIGPLDYFVSVKWLRRPDLSWPIAGAMLLLSSAGLAWYYQWLRPDKVVSNTVQIVDIDAVSGQTDGHVWSHVYSAQARTLSIQAKNTTYQTGVLLDWQGLPGAGLGGLQSQLAIASGLPAYKVEIQPDQSSHMLGVGVSAAGTKSLYGTYSGSTKIAKSSNLRELGTVDQLEGELINPLDVDLRDVTLFYHRWFYPLTSRIPAGQSFELSSQIIPKDIVRRLNKQDVDSKTSSTRWNPGERNELDRLLELMMFHNAATGRNYTSLTHSYQPIVDHSLLLESNNAILVGRLETSPIKIEVEPTGDSDNPAIETAIDRAWCRITIPVTPGRKPATP